MRLKTFYDIRVKIDPAVKVRESPWVKPEVAAIGGSFTFQLQNPTVYL